MGSAKQKSQQFALTPTGLKIGHPNAKGLTSLNNSYDIVKTMKLPGRDMSLWLIIVLDARRGH